ncbi:hypothetical protein ACFL1E_05290 [Candidatus Omnitrophota bacterium]
MAAKSKFQKDLEKLWPQTKKQLDKMAKEAMVLAKKSEKQLIALSEKGKLQFELTMLQLKKEQLFYNMGKLVSQKSKGKKKTAKVLKLKKELARLNRKISSLKKALEKK